ncbi:MAG: glycoside hydrolase family 3 C-terminal domain-containing protein [Ardenticatenaceae bacterium]|nr:glycoside hydrolase family 3 C-terminal domain-containing protein [Ardenticatenaceae bacterium]MCB9446554.1 glycoside hydrolase family 3 C-terminal domain-containing protein [Ardenticatenaceae bacterium]
MNNRFQFRKFIIHPLPVLMLALVFVLVFTANASAKPESAEVDLDLCPWMDTSLSADERARLLLDASTLEQKMRWIVEQPANSPTQTSWSGGVTYPVQVDCAPLIQYTDGPSTVVSNAGAGVTVFPAQIGLAATWDTALARAKGAAYAWEAFYKQRNVVLAPGVASGRTPLAGRNNEYFGEDPLLSGLMAAANIQGIQEDTPPDVAVEADLKHYVANEQETDRTSSSSNVDERTLMQIYILPWEIALKEGDPGSIMCAYNQVNGVYSCENGNILNDILKDYIGFEGFVMSDFGAVHSTSPSLVNGLDQELNRPRYFTPDLLNAALAAGEITEEQIDEAAFRVVRAHIKNGLFDVPRPTESLDNVSTDEHRDVARRVVEEGSVLLKNDNILPLSGSGSTIAVIGPTASNEPTDGISAASVCGPTAPTGPCTPVAPLDAITARATAEGNTVVFDNGSNLQSAAAAAAGADIAIVFGYYRAGEFSDLANLSLVPQANTSLFASAIAGDTNIKVYSTNNIQVGSTIFIDEETITATDIGTAATNAALALDAVAGDTNIKVSSVGGLVVGDMLSVDTGASLEVVEVTEVGTAGGTTLQSATSIGVTSITVASTSGFSVGNIITVDSGDNLETRTITMIDSRRRSITVDEALEFAHAAGVQVSGSGITFTPALNLDHARGAAIQSPGSGITFAPALNFDHVEGTAVFSSYGDDLISTVAAANPNTVVVLQTGGPVLMPWIDEVEGVLEVWWAGVEMGNAITNLLWGDVNPSGKLPQTFPVSEDDIPTAGSEAQYPGIRDEFGIRQVDYTEGLEVGYRWYDAQGIEPLFSFGYGLSYTTFEYSHLHVTPVRVQSDKEITVHFRVTNTGSVAGTEIAQVYLSLPAQVPDEPPKRLVGWARVTLEPGEHENVTIVIDPTSSAHPLSYWNTDIDGWVTAPGIYEVHVGGSSSANDLMTDTVLVWHRPGK